MTDAEMTSPPSNSTVPEMVKPTPEETPVPPAAEATPVEKPAEPKKPTIVEDADRLQVENIQLKAEKLQLELGNLNLQIQSCLTRRNMLQGEMDKLRRKMLDKYGFDLASVQINEDGTVQPAQIPGMPPGMPGMPGAPRRPMPMPVPGAVAPPRA
jgi:hypothetical protein